MVEVKEEFSEAEQQTGAPPVPPPINKSAPVESFSPLEQQTGAPPVPPPVVKKEEPKPAGVTPVEPTADESFSEVEQQAGAPPVAPAPIPTPKTIKVEPSDRPGTEGAVIARYAPGVKVNQYGQIVESVRSDIVLRQLIENGAPAEVIADYLRKNPDTYEAAQTWIEPVIKAVNNALEGKKVVEVETGGVSTRTRRLNPIKSSLEVTLFGDREALKAWRDGGTSALFKLLGERAERQKTLAKYQALADEQIKNFAFDNGIPLYGLTENKRLKPEEWQSVISGLLQAGIDPDVLVVGGYVDYKDLQAIRFAQLKQQEAQRIIEGGLIAADMYGSEVMRQLKATENKHNKELAATYAVPYMAKLFQGEQERYIKSIGLDEYKTKGGYNIDQYLIKNPDGVSKLSKTFNGTPLFGPDSITAALVRNTQNYGTGLQPWQNRNRFVRAYFQEQGWTYPVVSTAVDFSTQKTSRISALNRDRIAEANAAYDIAHPLPRLDFDNWYRNYYGPSQGWKVEPKIEIKASNLFGVKSPDKREKYARQNQAMQAYNALYGPGAAQLSNAGSGLAFLFAPARVLQPNVTIRDLTPTDWIIGAAQLVTLATFGVGGALGTAFGTLAGAGFTYATVKEWDNMTTGQRALSVGLDALMFLPLISSAVRGVRTLAGIKVSQFEAARQAAKAEQQLVRRIVSGYGRDTQAATTRLVNASGRYIELKVADLSPKPIRVRGQLIGTSKPTISQLQAARTELVKAAEQWTEATKGKIGFDYSGVTDAMQRLNKDIVRVIDDNLGNMLSKRGASAANQAKVTAAAREVERTRRLAFEAQQQLAIANAEWVNAGKPTTGKLFDALQKARRLANSADEKLRYANADYMGAEAQFGMGANAELAGIKVRLSKARELLIEIQDSMVKGEIKASDGRRLIVKYGNEIERLEKKFDENLKRLQVEYPERGFTSGGGTAVADRTGLKPITEQELRRIGAKRTTAPSLGGGIRAAGAGIATRTRRVTTTVTGTRPLTIPLTGITPDEFEQVSERVKQVTKAAALPASLVLNITRLVLESDEWNSNLNVTELNNLIQQKAQEATVTETATEIEPSTKTETETKPATATKVVPATKIIERTPRPERGKPGPKYVPQPEIERKKKLLAKPPKRTITYRHGLWWWTFVPPYKTKKDVIKSKQPPRGATVVTGPGSAYKTIQALGGNVNIVLTIDYGNQDVTIRNPRTKAGAPGAIRFKLDKGNKRKGDINISGIGGIR